MSPLGPPRGWVAAIAVGAVVSVGAVLGTLTPVEEASSPPVQREVTGATTSVCNLSTTVEAATSVDVVTAAQASGGATDGTLTGTPLAAKTDAKPVLDLDQAGTGDTLEKLTTPLLLRAESGLAASTAAAVYSTARDGVDRGLMLAPCATPGTDQWLVGLGADSTAGSEIVLANPDATQAEVDLRFYGADGEIVVPGSPAIPVPAHDSVTVSLPSLLTSTSPVSVEVRNSRGRVSAVARDLRSAGTTPLGADWHPTSVTPARQVVVSAVPPGAGSRELRVVNPGNARAVAQVSVLGADGEFAPSGAEQLELAPHTTRTVELSSGLAGAGASVRLSADQPVTAAVVSSTPKGSAGSARTDDIAVAVADTPVLQRALAPVAYLPDTTATLVLSNVGRSVASVKVSVVGLDGVVVSSDEVPVAENASAVRTIRSSQPVFLQVEVPTGSSVYGGVAFAGTSASPGLTGMGLVSPDVTARAPTVVEDPAVAR